MSIVTVPAVRATLAMLRLAGRLRVGCARRRSAGDRRRTALVLPLVLAFLTACNSSSVPPTGVPSRTGLLLSDIHFNPLADPALANQLAQAPASQWDSIFATSALTAYSYSYAVPGYGTLLVGDTNFPLLQSVLGAMRQRVPNPDIIFVSGDFLVHALPVLFAKFVTNKSPAAYATFVNTTEQYLALKLSQTFPNAQIVPTLGDWDTPCGSSGTYPGAAFLAAFSAAWNPAVNRFGGSPDFQAAFATGGYYATAFPIDPRGRLIVLDTQPWSPTYQSGCQAGAGPGTLGNVELAWLSAQLDSARSGGQRVWILGHIPPGVPGLSPTGQSGVDLDASSRAQAVTGGAACPIATFYTDAYSSQLYALFTQNRDLLTLGIFGHEHMDDYRVLRDSSGNPIFGMKIVPSVTPFDGNNPAFVQFSYDPAAGVISDATTWYLTNLATAKAAAPGVWGLEYDFDRTYGQNALDSNGVAGAVTQILAQLSAREAFARYYPSSSPAIALTPFLPFGCALNNLTAADYGACYCGH